MGAGESVFNIGPGSSRGPIVFSSREVFPSLVEDLMRSPRGLVFKVANFDIVTADERNFAFGLQDIRERTTGLVIDFGDGEGEQFQAIAAGVLNRPRDEFRCAPDRGGSNELCNPSDQNRCDGQPDLCEGGKIVGGFSEFDGTGEAPGIPLDFVLSDILGMRRSAPGRLLVGPNGIADSVAMGDDVQLIQPGDSAAPDDVAIAAGRNGILDTSPSSDDLNPEAPDGIFAGPNGIVESFVAGDDVQLVPIGTRGVPEDEVVISAGADGVLDTPVQGDDVADVVTGYEVSRTCSADTPFAIIAGPNEVTDTLATDGICVLAFAPGVVGAECVVDEDCGVDTTRTVCSGGPSNLDGVECFDQGDCGGGQCANAVGLCSADDQVVPFGAFATSPDGVVVGPGTVDFVASVPGGDDILVGPGMPCSSDADCSTVEVPPLSLTSGFTGSGTCTGGEAIVRVRQRRNGQFRRFWALLLPDSVQFQTDYSRIKLKPGDLIGLKFIQDIDRDGLDTEIEFINGSSDFKRDTDDDTLDDFSEIRIGWEVGVVGQPLRRVFPDPRVADSDRDGLTDREEQDLRFLHCECAAEDSQGIPTAGHAPRGAIGFQTTPCNDDSQCGGFECRDTVNCGANVPLVDGLECPPCPTDVTLMRTDPRRVDTDDDGIDDFREVFGVLTGEGIVDLAGSRAILAGQDLIADSLACPSNYCASDPSQHCQTDGDCELRQCIKPEPCWDIQVVEPGGRCFESPNGRGCPWAVRRGPGELHLGLRRWTGSER